MDLEFVFPIAEIQQKAGVNDTQLAQKLHLDRTHLGRTRAGKSTDLSFSELQRLVVWAASENAALPYVRPHALWETFRNRTFQLYRGGGGGLSDTWDLESETLITRLSHKLGAKRIPAAKVETVDIRIALTTQNCIFIGGPRRSAASEYALAHLLEVQPFTADAPVLRTRFKFSARNWDSESAKSSFYSPDDNNSTGILAALEPDGEPALLPVQYVDNVEEYFASSQPGNDAGVLVVCRRPFKCQADVTTIVLCGYTGFATLDMLKSLTEEGASIHENVAEWTPHLTLRAKITPGAPLLRFFTTRYKKERGGDNRTPAIASRRWIWPHPAS